MNSSWAQVSDSTDTYEGGNHAVNHVSLSMPDNLTLNRQLFLQCSQTAQPLQFFLLPLSKDCAHFIAHSYRSATGQDIPLKLPGSARPWSSLCHLHCWDHATAVGAAAAAHCLDACGASAPQQCLAPSPPPQGRKKWAKIAAQHNLLIVLWISRAWTWSMKHGKSAPNLNLCMSR